MDNNEILDKPKAVKNFLKSQSFPIVLKNMLKWHCFNWDLLKWQEVLGEDTQLEFRIGKHISSEVPQYESITEVKNGSFQDLMEYNKSQELWAYFDYKYLNTWLVSNKLIRKDIRWDNLGFPDKSADDSTIWIGTKGSHSNCHIDTYGFNIVAQVYGQKQWILFPPNEDLKASRIPYEESTIYSKFNLFSPTVNDFKHITKAYSVTLNPGEVLLVPNGWWHYVENLDFAISINIWIEHEMDYINHCREATAQLIVAQLTKGLSEIDQKHLVTPSNKHTPLQNVQDLAKTIQIFSNPSLKYDNARDPNMTDASFISEAYIKVPQLSASDFKSLLLDKRNRFNIYDGKAVEDDNVTIPIIQHIIEYVTNPDVLNPLTETLIKKLWQK